MIEELINSHTIYVLEGTIQLFKDTYSSILSLEGSYPKGIMDFAFGLAADLNRDSREAQKLIDQRLQYKDKLFDLVKKHEKAQKAVLAEMKDFENEECVV